MPIERATDTLPTCRLAEWERSGPNSARWWRNSFWPTKRWSVASA